MVKSLQFYGIISMNLILGGIGLRDVEKYYCEHIVLGLPKAPARFFLRLFLEKGIRATVYAEHFPPSLRLLGMARFCKIFPQSDQAILDVIQRHAMAARPKRVTLLYAPLYKGFINRNRDELEKRLIVRGLED